MLKPEKIDFQDFHIRGKWNLSKMTEWVKKISKEYENQVIAIPVSDFFKEFHLGQGEIKYSAYYSKKHLENCMKKAQINGRVATSKNRLMVQFQK